jgi:hypothetical protein
MKNLVTTLVIFLFIFFQSCNNSQTIDLKNYRIDKEIRFDSRNKLKGLLSGKEVEKNWIQEVFENTVITSKNGDFWEGMESKIYSIGKINSESETNWIIAKQIFLVDGELTEFYLIRLNSEMNLEEIIYLGNAGEYVQCNDYVNLTFNSEKGKVDYFNSCFSGFDEKKDVTLFAIKNIKTEMELKERLIVKRDTLNYIIEEN